MSKFYTSRKTVIHLLSDHVPTTAQIYCLMLNYNILTKNVSIFKNRLNCSYIVTWLSQVKHIWEKRKERKQIPERKNSPLPCSSTFITSYPVFWVQIKNRMELNLYSDLTMSYSCKIFFEISFCCIEAFHGQQILLWHFWSMEIYLLHFWI